MRWSSLSIRVKLTALTMTVFVVALALSGTGLIAYARLTARSQLTTRLQGMADLIGTSSSAAVQSGNVTAGADALAAFRSDPLIETAAIILPDGTPFAHYVGAPDPVPHVSRWSGLAGSITVRRPLTLDDREIGTIEIQGRLRSVQVQFPEYIMVLLVALGVAGVAAFVLTVGLQRIIAGPILQLTHTTRRISAIGDYRVRAERQSADELGQLADQFNEMLAQIQHRDARLGEMRDQLEDRVRERTKQLELEVVAQRRTEEVLIMGKAAAEEANVAKSTFLANMSHELRTPLNAILGFSEILKEEAEDRGAAQDVKDVDRIIAAGRHLLSLINAVLDLSRIEAGRMGLEVQSFDLARFIRSVVDLAVPLAAKHGNELIVGPLDGLGMMKSDHTKVQQILVNVLGNACKFTGNGQVHLDVSRGGDLTDDVVFRIRDTGIGISRKQQETLFRDFSQADTSTTQEQGTGLGLAISQRLCRLLGGSIGLESTLGVGSTFTVRLPAEHAEDTSDAPPGGVDFARGLVNGRAGDSTTPTVLVIDDDASARDLAGRVVGRAGFRVIEAANAEDGLQLVRTFTFAAIILEVALRDVDGWTVLRRLKNMRESAAVPVIVTSVKDEPRRSLALGAVEHVTKPFEAIALIRILRQAVASEHVAAHALSTAELLAAPGTTASAM